MKVGVLGYKGRMGQVVMNELARKGHQAVANPLDKECGLSYRKIESCYEKNPFPTCRLPLQRPDLL